MTDFEGVIESSQRFLLDDSSRHALASIGSDGAIWEN